MKIKNILSSFIFFSITTIMSFSQEMDYNQVIALPGGFANAALSNVHKLDLSNVPLVIDDNFVTNNLVNNNNLRKIITLDLSGNNNITNQSINNILNSQFIGSLRNLPEDSERFGCRSSTIRIKARGTSVVHPQQQGTNKFEVHSANNNFAIYYFSNATGQIYDQIANGMKFVDVDLS